MTYSVSTRGGGLIVAVAGWTLAATLVLLAALHVYWVLGGEWGLDAALGTANVEPTRALRAAAGVVGVLLVAAAAGVLARVGVWTPPLPWRVVAVGTWLLVAALVLAALVNATAKTALERFGFAPFALALAVLAAVVALSRRPE